MELFKKIWFIIKVIFVVTFSFLAAPVIAIIWISTYIILVIFNFVIKDI